MGTIYYALNPETRQVYELGKGAWFALADDGVLDCSDVERLTARALAMMEDYGFVVDDLPAYAREIAEALSAFRPTKVLSDASDDIYDEDGDDLYERIGSRYRD